MCREYTMEEVRSMFLEHVHNLVDYWERLPGKEMKERLEGLAFSILVALDGESATLPSFMVVPDPHEDDKAYFQNEGENWFPEPAQQLDGLEWLHEHFYEKNKS